MRESRVLKRGLTLHTSSADGLIDAQRKPGHPAGRQCARAVRSSPAADRTRGGRPAGGVAPGSADGDDAAAARGDRDRPDPSLQEAELAARGVHIGVT
jgi:hypothetical protein